MEYRFVIFNWKLNPGSSEEADRLMRDTEKAVQGVERATVVACPPFQYLFDFVNRKSKIVHLSLGAQDCFWESGGAHTGEISPVALKQTGISYVIVGHSERALAGETDEMVAKKIVAACEAGLVPVVCVGENAAVHAKGSRAVEKFLAGQLAARLERARAVAHHYKQRMILVYEPIWAISTHSGNVSDAPEDAAAGIAWMKREAQKLLALDVSLPVLYGGSVNGANCEALAARREIDGFLVGHASLNPKEVRTIVAAADQI